MQNDKVQAEAESHGAKQEWVDPWGHNQQRLVFRQGIDGVAHLNGDQDGKSESHGFGSLENVAAQTLEFFGFGGALEEMAELGVVHLGSGGVVQEPVGSSTDGGETNINTNGHVTEKQPGGDQSLFRGPKMIKIKNQKNVQIVNKDTWKLFVMIKSAAIMDFFL